MRKMKQARVRSESRAGRFVGLLEEESKIFFNRDLRRRLLRVSSDERVDITREEAEKVGDFVNYIIGCVNVNYIIGCFNIYDIHFKNLLERRICHWIYKGV